MELKEIMDKKKHGDLKLTAKMLGIGYQNALMVLRRPNARRHPALLVAMAKIIKAREALLRSAGKQKT